MRLDRNVPPFICKYAIVPLRAVIDKLRAAPSDPVSDVLRDLADKGTPVPLSLLRPPFVDLEARVRQQIAAEPERVEFAAPGSDREFFVLRVADKFAADTLDFYASLAENEDPEYAADVREMAARSRALANRHFPD